MLKSITCIYIGAFPYFEMKRWEWNAGKDSQCVGSRCLVPAEVDALLQKYTGGPVVHCLFRPFEK